MTVPPAETTRERQLLDSTRQITGSLDVGEVLARITREAARLLDGAGAALLLREGGELSVAEAWGLPTATGQRLPLGAGAMAAIQALGRDAGLPACVGVPMVLGPETIGVLATYRAALRAGEDDEALLSALADQASVALQNARLYRESKERAEALRESEERFRLAMDQAPIGIALIGLDGRFARVNAALCDMLGYTSEELLERTFADVTHPDWVDVGTATFQQLLRGDIARCRFAKLYLRKDGGVVEAVVSSSLLRGPDGAPRHLVSVIEDVTDQRRAQEALRASEERLALAVEAAGLGLWDWDLVADESHLSPLYWELIGNPIRPQRLGLAFFESLIVPEDRPEVQRRLRAHLEGRAPESILEYRIHKPSGETAWLSGRGRVVARDPSGAPQRMVGVILDITTVKRDELERQLLAEAGAVLGAALEPEETLADLARLIVRDLAEVCIVEVFDRAEALRWRLAIHANPARQHLCDQLTRLALADPRRLAAEALDRRHPVLYEDLDPAWLDAHTTDEARPLWRALAPRSLLAVPLIAHQRLQGALVWASTQPHRYDTREVHLAEELGRRAALTIDNARLYEEARHASATRDEVLAVVAHDLRNPMSAVKLGAQIVAQQLGTEDRGRRSVDNILRACGRAERLITDLLDVASIEAGGLSLAREAVPVEPILWDVIETQQPLADAAGLELRLQLHGPLQPVWADRDRLLQVLENLVGNALKFTPRGGRVTLGAAAERDAIRVWIEDTGPGLTPEAREHVFDRFWQAERTDRRGAGLGLAICKGLVEAHGGHIWVESTPGRGTTFHLTLPLALHAATGAAPTRH